MEWFEELGFDSNPFNIDPLRTHLRLVGREQEAKELLYRITSGSILLIEGRAGTGKTALIKHAIDNFKGRGRVIYVDANKLNKRLNISNLLNKKPKGMILLMDNVHFLSKKNNERIKYYYDQDYIQSVVFTTTAYKQARFSDAIKDRIGKNIIKLKYLKPEEATEIVMLLLGDKEILPDNVLKQLYYYSKKNMNNFLVKCGLLCGYLVEKGKEKAVKRDIKKMPKKKEEKVVEEDKTKKCVRCNEELVKINDSWRCKACDEFCKHCGALIDKEDGSCPECGTKLIGGKE